jgi:hypothetical protein
MHSVLEVGKQPSTKTATPWQWASLRREVILGLLVTVLVYIVLLWHNWNYVITDVAPYGDIAADMLLIERAKHDWLLIGHYSRFGFNHPGPFFLYARHLAEMLVGDALPSPYNAHLLVIIGLSAVFIGIAASTVAALVDSDRKTAVMAAAATVLVLLIQDQGIGILAHPWMPFQLVPPFFAFVLLLAGTALGRLWMLPVASLCGAVLVHGYLPLVPFVALPWLLALGCAVLQRRRSDPQAPMLPAGPLALSAVIISVFMMPLILDMAVHPPGNIIKLWNVTRAITPQSGASLGDVAAFIWQFWKPAAPVYSDLSIFSVTPALWILAALCIPVACRDPKARSAVAHVIVVAALMTLLLALYVWRAPGPPYPYIAEFYLAVPLAVIAVATAGAAIVIVRWAPRSVGLAVAALSIVLVSKGSLTSPNQNVAGIRELSDGVLDHLGDRKGEGVRISFDNHDNWVFVTGLLLDLERRGVPICVEAPHLAVLFTPERICERTAPGHRYVLVASSACATTCIARSQSLPLGLALPPEVPPYLLGTVLDVVPGRDTGRPYRGSGWSIPDLDGIFSNAPEAEFNLPVAQLTDAPLQLRVKAWSFVAKELPRQEIEVVVNGQPVTTWVFTTADPIGERVATIPAEVARLQQPLSILFRMPNAASPLSLGLSTDSRQLGIGLQWLRLDAAPHKTGLSQEP